MHPDFQRLLRPVDGKTAVAAASCAWQHLGPTAALELYRGELEALATHSQALELVSSHRRQRDGTTILPCSRGFVSVRLLSWEHDISATDTTYVGTYVGTYISVMIWANYMYTVYVYQLTVQRTTPKIHP